MTQRSLYLGVPSWKQMEGMVSQGYFVSVSEIVRSAVYQYLKEYERGHHTPIVGDVEERNGLIMEYRANEKWCAIGRVNS